LLKFRAQCLKWKVPGPPLDHAVDLGDDLGRGERRAVTAGESLDLGPEALPGVGRRPDQGEPAPRPPTPRQAHREPEKGKGLPLGLQNAGLGRIQRQAQALELPRHGRAHLLSRTLAEHHEVVRVADEPSLQAALQTLSSPDGIHLVERDVGEQGRDSPTLRGPPAGPPAAPRLPLPVRPFHHHRRPQPPRQEAEDLGIRHPAGDRGEEVVVRDRVEEGRESGVEHLRVAPEQGAGDLLQCLVGVFLGAEAVGARQEVRLEDRLQHQAGGGLDHPGPNRRDAERAFPAPPLGDPDTPDGIGPVSGRAEFLGNASEESLDPGRLYGGERDPIHSWGTSIRPHQGPGVTQDVRPRDLVVEEVEPERWLLLGLAVELPLERPHRLWRLEPHGNPPAGFP